MSYITSEYLASLLTLRAFEDVNVPRIWDVIEPKNQ